MIVILIMISVWDHNVIFCSKFTINTETFLRISCVCSKFSFQRRRNVDIHAYTHFISHQTKWETNHLWQIWTLPEKRKYLFLLCLEQLQHSKRKFCSGHFKSNNGSVVWSKETNRLSIMRENKSWRSVFYKTMMTCVTSSTAEIRKKTIPRNDKIIFKVVILPPS